MTESNFNSGYTSFSPLSPEAKSITSGFSFSRLFDFPWRKEKPGSIGQANLNISGKAGNTEEADKSSQQSKTPDITISFDKKNESLDEANSSVIISGNHVGYGKSKSANSSPCLPRKEKGRYRNVKTILRRLSAIAVDRKWHQVFYGILNFYFNFSTISILLCDICLFERNTCSVEFSKLIYMLYIYIFLYLIISYIFHRHLVILRLISNSTGCQMSTAKSVMNVVANLVHFEEDTIVECVARYFVVVAVAKKSLGKIWDLVVIIRTLTNCFR